MSDTAPAETVDASKNDANVTPTPAPAPVKAEDTSAVEQLRKEKEQAEMRANQLANQLKAKEEAEAEAKAKELEEQNQYKELFEQEKAKREAIEAEREEAETKAELNKARTEVLAGYSDEVKELAKEVGLELSSADEAEVATFKEKLDKLNAKVAKTPSVGPNNTRPTNSDSELSAEYLQENLRNDKQFHEIVTSRFPGIAAMTSPKK